jgi:glycine/D-amino acid oxidase-like deaminating enzyme
MTIKKAYHVVVIGGGITGLSTALHLKKKGITRIAVSQANTLGTPTRIASGFCSGGQLDNFTRLSHVHGMDLARQLWSFGNDAFDSLVTFAKEHQVPVMSSRRYRFLASNPELTEAKKAVSELESNALQGSILPPPHANLSSRILSIQDDGPRGGYIDPESLFQAITHSTSSIPRLPPVETLERKNGSISLKLEDGHLVLTDVVVVAAHLHTGALIPELGSSLVPFADQWTDFGLSKGTLPELCSPGLAFTTNHTYEWGVVTDKNRIRFGGARYLRPLAGLETTHCNVDPQITAHLKMQLANTFKSIDPDSLVARATYSFLDIRPCDELPMIGPMFGEPRILVGTGFSGQGIQTGFHAGSMLASLIAQGEAPGLPRALWPERLRSLPQSN